MDPQWIMDKLHNKNDFRDSTLDSSSIKSSSVDKLATKNSLQSDSILDNSSIEPSYMEEFLTKKTLQSDHPNRPAKKFHTRVYNFQNGLHNNAKTKSAEKISNPELLTKNSLQSDSILEKSSMIHSSVDKLPTKNSLQSDFKLDNSSMERSSVDKLVDNLSSKNSDSILDKSSIKGSSVEKLPSKNSAMDNNSPSLDNTATKIFKNCSSKGM